MLGQPRALLFDLDGTLLMDQVLSAAIETTARQLADSRPDLAVDAVLAANQAAFASYMPEVERAWTLGKLDTPSLAREAWRRTLLTCGVEDGPLLAQVTSTFLAEVKGSHRLYDDALPLLEVLKGRFKLALVTNGASGLQREKLHCTGIEALFEVVTVSGEHGVAKPERRIFELTLAALAVPPQEAWHIGDNLEADVAGAQGAGVTGVWINRHGREARSDVRPPDIEIANLSELPRYLAVGD